MPWIIYQKEKKEKKLPRLKVRIEQVLLVVV